jgi:tetratricopeptide (TPR) repeat protein
VYKQGKVDEAIAEFRQAIRLSKNDASAHHKLGIVLYKQGKLNEAIAEFRLAICINKDFAEPHNNLGCVLLAKGRLDEAIAAFHEAIRLDKDNAEAHCNLGHALRDQGEFGKALKALRHGHELGQARGPNWRYPSARWVRQCQRLVELDGKLAGFLEGKSTPASPTERIEVASLCARKRLNSAAARFYAEAFAAQPALAADLQAGHRYNAACSAALAGCGQGKDADKLDDLEQYRVRQQGLTWLRDDLEAWRKHLESAEAKRRVVVQETLKRWQWDAAFAGVRGAVALARLAATERQLWQALWTQVAETLTLAGGRTSPVRKK